MWKQKQINMLQTKIAELKTKMKVENYQLSELKSKMATEKHELLGIIKCTVKGHSFQFDGTPRTPIHSGHHYCSPLNYQFKCSKCGLTIVKDENELTVKEKNALRTLGIPETKTETI